MSTVIKIRCGTVYFYDGGFLFVDELKNSSEDHDARTSKEPVEFWRLRPKESCE